MTKNKLMLSMLGLLVIWNIINLIDIVSTRIAMIGPFVEINSFAAFMMAKLGLITSGLMKVGIVGLTSYLIYKFLDRLGKKTNYSVYYKSTSFIFLLLIVGFIFIYSSVVISNIYYLINY